MADIEKIIEDLASIKRVGIEGSPAHIKINNAIQTIRELQELNKGLSETYTSNPMYEIGYEKGASDMEKAKQIIIDKLLEQIPKWHLVDDGDLPKDEEEILILFREKGMKKITPMKAIGRYVGLSDGNMYFYVPDWGYFEHPLYTKDQKTKWYEVIAWMELAKFDEVE